jgi:hypothetical protein
MEITVTADVDSSIDCAGKVGCSNRIVTYSFKPTAPGDYAIELRSGHAWAKQEYYEVVIIHLTVLDANGAATTVAQTSQTSTPINLEPILQPLVDFWYWLWQLPCWIPGSKC